MSILLSIKPEYVKKIIEGEKKYEFRKLNCKSIKESEKIFIYSSSPMKRIIGFFKVGTIIEDKPDLLWKQFNNVSGVNKKQFFEYFENTEFGVALPIKELVVFENPIEPKDIFETFIPPQSYYYFDENLLGLT